MQFRKGTKLWDNRNFSSKYLDGVHPGGHYQCITSYNEAQGTKHDALRPSADFQLVFQLILT